VILQQNQDTSVASRWTICMYITNKHFVKREVCAALYSGIGLTGCDGGHSSINTDVSEER
jgi:hypothetical protein